MRPGVIFMQKKNTLFDSDYENHTIKLLIKKREKKKRADKHRGTWLLEKMGLRGRELAADTKT